MKAVWKYPLTGWGAGSNVRYEIKMPGGATVLTLQDQGGVSTLWAEVDPDSPAVTRIFEWAGTGHPVPDGGVYVGTALVQGGAYVFHLYEVTA
jgi:hypothetical protein